VERKTGRARTSASRSNACVHAALARWHRHRDSPVADFKVEADALQTALTSQLRDRCLKAPDHQRLLNALGWPHDRGHVLHVLTDHEWRPRTIGPNGPCAGGHGAQGVARLHKQHRRHTCGDLFQGVRTLANQGIKSLGENLYQLFRGPDVQATSPDPPLDFDALINYHF